MEKIIIIGGGITGLSTGIHGLLKGYDVTIYEKNPNAGGCCNGWVREGYYIDNCMHWLTGANQTTKDFALWKTLGAINETSNLYQGEYFYKSILGENCIALYTDTEKTRNEMIKLSPIDSKEINCFIDIVNQVIKTKKEKNIFRNIVNYMVGYSRMYRYYHNLSLEDLANKFNHPLLQKLFTDYIPGDYTSMALILSYATFASGDGKVYVHGSQQFSSNIVNRFISLGGKIVYNSEVDKINLIYNTTGEMSVNSISVKNDIINGDIFIICSDPFTAFNKLLPSRYMPFELIEKVNNKKDYPVYSSFHVAFLVDKKKHLFTDTTIIEIPKTKCAVSEINRLVVKEYSYLNKDNQDKIVYQLFVMQKEEDYMYWEKLYQDKEIYQKEKSDLSKTLLSLLVNTYPDLKGSKIIDSWTPITYSTYFNSYLGSYLGFTPTKNVSISNIPFKIKGVCNLYLGTYWQRISGGLPVAAQIGKDIIDEL